MDDDEDIGPGLSAIQTLSEGAIGLDPTESRARLESLLRAIPDDTAYRSAYRDRLSSLLHTLEAHPAPWSSVPSAVCEAARACRGPVPLSRSQPPPPPSKRPPVRSFTPVRAMAVGGGRTDRYSDGQDAYSDAEFFALMRATVDALTAKGFLHAAVLVDREGQFLESSGEVDRAIVCLPPTADALARLRLADCVTSNAPDGVMKRVHMLVSDRLLLCATFDPETSELARFAIDQAVRAIADALEAIPEDGPDAFSDDDLRNVLVD